MMSSLMPSEKYSCSGSPERLANGSTAIAVRSSTGSWRMQRARRWDRVAGAQRSARFDTVRGFRLHVADEAKTFSRKGADHDLILAAVADRPARGVDPARQRGFGDDAAIPHRLDQIVLGDDMVAVFDQVNQQIEHLRLDRHAFAAAGQLAKVDIEHMVGKVKLHGFIPVKSSQITSVPHAREGRANLPSGKCEKSHRKEISLKNQGGSQGKISPASQSLGPDRAMFGSSRPHSVAA